jgi:hypothetical protein
MATDNDSLFSQATTKRPSEGDLSEKRKLLRRYDHLAAQALNPFGVSELEKATLSQLWELIRNGNKTTRYFAEWADESPYRKGIAVSRLAEVLQTAIQVLKDGKFAQLLNKEVLDKATKEAADLSPHLTVLNGGKSSQTAQKVTMSTLGLRNVPARAQEEVEISAKVLYEWLQKDQSTLRGLLSFLAQGGVFYAASVAEKGARSYVKCAKETKEDFISAAVARLSKPDAVQEIAPDDTSILFTTPVKSAK